MNPPLYNVKRQPSNQVPDFFLFKGGLITNFLTPINQKPIKKAIILGLFCWIPYVLVLIFRLQDPTAIQAAMAILVPVHVRFLFALPILVASEWFVDRRIPIAIKHLLSTHFMPIEDQKKGINLIKKTRQTLDLTSIDGVIIIGVIALAISKLYRLFFGGRPYFQEEVWLICIALPIFQILLLRWLVRTVVWTKLLFHISRLRIHILPTHADGMGGLAFLNWVQSSFAWISLSLASVLVADHWSNWGVSWQPGAGLDPENLTVLIKNLGTLLLPSLILFLGPLLFFSPLLFLQKGIRLMDLSMFSDRCSTDFETQWVAEAEKNNDQPALTPEISEIADLMTVFNVSRRMPLILIDKKTFITFIIASLVPILPLLLTIIPITAFIEVGKRIFL
jgi:hypothetical protein